MTTYESLYEILENASKTGLALQRCPVCKSVISALPGTRDATCHTCGFKDPCCE